MALNTFHRLLFYGMLGMTYEILFSSTWDFIASNFSDFKFQGYTSVWSFFIYGTCSYCGERVFLRIKNNMATFFRGLVYLKMAYTWEFFSGLLLRQFSACTWDYTHYYFDVMGLIALEYAPFWFLAGLFQEKIYDFLLNLRIESNPQDGVVQLEKSKSK